MCICLDVCIVWLGVYKYGCVYCIYGCVYVWVCISMGVYIAYMDVYIACMDMCIACMDVYMFGCVYCYV